MTTSGSNARALRAADDRTVLPKTPEADRKQMSSQFPGPGVAPTPGSAAFRLPSAPKRFRVVQYELNVVGSSVLDVVSRVGGWLFDMGMAGWNVGVALGVTPTEPDHDRALRILGVKTAEVTDLWPVSGNRAEHAVLTAIATERFESDPEVRRRGLHALREGVDEIAFWGPACPEQLGGRVRRTEYRPSAAARAFKAHALIAAGAADDQVGAAETVYCRGEILGGPGADPVTC